MGAVYFRKQGSYRSLSGDYQGNTVGRPGLRQKIGDISAKEKTNSAGIGKKNLYRNLPAVYRRGTTGYFGVETKAGRYCYYTAQETFGKIKKSIKYG